MAQRIGMLRLLVISINRQKKTNYSVEGEGGGEVKLRL
jgi:hypothetical protein